MATRQLCLTFFGCLILTAAAHSGELAPNLASLSKGQPSSLRAASTATARATAQASGQAQRIAAAQPSPFDPHVDAAQRVQIYIHAGSHGSLPTDSSLLALGAVDIRRSSALQVVQAWLPVSKLRMLAARADVGLVSIPVYRRQQIPPAVKSTLVNGKLQSRSIVGGIAIDNEALAPMQADHLQQLNAQGSGIKVGVISGDNAGLAESQAGGYLPANVWADPIFPGITPTPGDPAEGTAMLEEVHAIAPKAILGFCAPNTSVDLLSCYQDFVGWGANIITDDLGFPSIDMFSAGLSNDMGLAYAVAQFTQAHPQVAITSAGGNDAADYYQAAYTPTPSSGFSEGGTTYISAMDFGAASGGASNSTLGVPIPAGSAFTPVLQWNDPVSAVSDQFSLLLYDVGGKLLASSTSNPADTGRPGVALAYTAGASDENDFLVIGCISCAHAVTLKLLGQGNGASQFGFTTEGSVGFGQVIAPGVMTTVSATVNSGSPLSITRENYSATGPFLYGDYSNTNTLAKPDLTGIGHVTVSGAGGFGQAQAVGALFSGTSATAPNVAALIADLMSAYPGQNASFYYNALKTTARQAIFTSYTQSGEGSGLAGGYDALASFFIFPATAISTPVAVAHGGSGSYTVPTNAAISFSASVTAGSNAANGSQCFWLIGPSSGATTIYTGQTVSHSFNQVGSYTIKANCPDSRGIIDPNVPTLTINAQSIPAPMVTIGSISNDSISITLSGQLPLTVNTSSSNNGVLASNGIQLSSGCGSITLICTATVSPVSNANGSSTLTITASDSYGRSGQASTTFSYSYTPPASSSSSSSSSSSKHGGTSGPEDILLILSLLILRRRHRSNGTQQ